MSIRRESKGARPEINVTPFIDILLVLLIIFMVAAPLRPARFKTLVPEPPPDDERINLSPRTLVVELDGELRLRLIRGRDVIAEGRAGDSGAVTARLAREFDERRAAGSWRSDAEHRADLPADERIEKTVFIRAPRSIPYGEVARVVDGVKGAGASPVGLQTDELAN